jgi:hypothetical protein
MKASNEFHENMSVGGPYDEHRGDSDRELGEHLCLRGLEVQSNVFE